MAALPDLAAPLTDGVIALRRTAERDIPEILIAHQDDPDLHRRRGLARPPSAAELGRACEDAERERLAGTAVELTLTEAGSDVCRGQVILHRVDAENERAELGVWLEPGSRGRGWGARALRLAGRWAFEAAALRRLEVLTEPDNDAMLAAARAAGFAQEGVLRGFWRERSRRVDCVVLSRLAGEP